MRLFAESIGAGFEGKLAEVTAVAVSPIVGGVAYDVTLNVGAAIRTRSSSGELVGVCPARRGASSHDNVF